MSKEKKSFIAYSDWKEVFDELPNEEAGILIKHIFAYVNGENPESDSVLIRAIFANIKSTLMRDQLKWENQLTQRVEAGKRSAELRALNKDNERSTVVESRERNPTDNVSVSVSVSDSVNVNDKGGNRKRFTPPTILEVQEYCKERNNTVNADKFINHYTANGWMVGKNKMKDWKASVRTWEVNEFNAPKQAEDTGTFSLNNLNLT